MYLARDLAHFPSALVTGSKRWEVADLRREFLLGNDILVAPILTPDTRARNILLPPGFWRDYWSGRLFEGNQTLNNYAAPLDTLLIFERQE